MGWDFQDFCPPQCNVFAFCAFPRLPAFIHTVNRYAIEDLWQGRDSHDSRGAGGGGSRRGGEAGVGVVCGTECSIFFSSAVDPASPSTGQAGSYPAHELIRAASFPDASNSAVSAPPVAAAAAEEAEEEDNPPAVVVGAAAKPHQPTSGTRSSSSSKRKRGRQLAAAASAEAKEEEVEVEEEGKQDIGGKEEEEEEEERYGSNERRRRKKSSSPGLKARGRKRRRHRDRERDSDRPPRLLLEDALKDGPDQPGQLLLPEMLTAQDAAAVSAAVDAAAAASLGPVADGLASPTGTGSAAAASPPLQPMRGLAQQVSMDDSRRHEGGVHSPHLDGRGMQLPVPSDGKAPAGPPPAADLKVAEEGARAGAKGRGGGLPAQVRVCAPRAYVSIFGDNHEISDES